MRASYDACDGRDKELLHITASSNEGKCLPLTAGQHPLYNVVVIAIAACQEASEASVVAGHVIFVEPE